MSNNQRIKILYKGTFADEQFRLKQVEDIRSNEPLTEKMQIKKQQFQPETNMSPSKTNIWNIQNRDNCASLEQKIPQEYQLWIYGIPYTMSELTSDLLARNFQIRIRKLYKVTQLCQICLLQNDNQLFSLDCGHVFHKNCCKLYIRSLIENRNPYIICPQNKCCRKKINILLSKEAQFNWQTLRRMELGDICDSYIQLQFDVLVEKFENIHRCPNPKGCVYHFVRTTTTTTNHKLNPYVFFCEVCGNKFNLKILNFSSSYCLKCNHSAHPKFITCEGYSRVKNLMEKFLIPIEKQIKRKYQETFQELIEVENLKKCQMCQALISKSEGSNHMTCHCGFEFCYKCGLPYWHPQCNCPLYDDQ